MISAFRPRTSRRSAQVVLVSCLLGVGVSAASALASGPPAQPRLVAAKRWEAAGVALGIHPDAAGKVRVRVVLAGNALTKQALSPGRRGALSGRLRSDELAAAKSMNANEGLALAEQQQAQRAGALRELGSAVDRNAALQQHVRRGVVELGGSVVDADLIGNAITARVPAGAIEKLGARADVATIESDVRDRKLGLASESAVVGAPSFWASGYLGGTGSSDTSPTDLAIFIDKIQEDHPAFAGITFQRPPDTGVGTPCGSAFSFSCDHGTAVASAAISRGASGCLQCVPDDADQKGVAPGLDTVLDAEYNGPGNFSELPWALGISVHVGVYDQDGASDPAEVGSSSAGSPIAQDDSDEARATDNVVATYGLSSTDAAGNEGPAQSVNEPCIAYNTLCMGGFDRDGTADPSDDVIPDFSSRGPTPAGRKKPDLVGVAVPSEYANRRWFVSGQGLWDSSLEGTSFASPQGAGAMALLAGSGISDPVAQKAILINSARQGRATPSDPMGSQTGWQADWGWGALDLSAALGERTNFQTASVPAGSARLFKATIQSSGDRATLVWNRRATGCAGPTCVATPYTFSNLDLEQVDAGDGSSYASSASAIDNVEQVRAPASSSGEDVIYKVRASSAIDGLAAEPFALASRRPLQALGSPIPSVALDLSDPSAQQGDQVTVHAHVANASADLAGEDAEISLQLPSGTELAPGSDPITQNLGTLSKAGQVGDQADATWVVRGTSDGFKQLDAEAQAMSYGESFSASDQQQLTVDSTAPTVVLNAPAGATGSTSLPLSWGASDLGVGVDHYDIEVSTDGGAFSALLTATSATSTAYSASVAHSYRFRARAADQLGNLSNWVTSEQASVVQEPGPPRPPEIVRVSPKIRLVSVRRTGSRIHVEGRAEAGVQASIDVVFRGRYRGRAVSARTRTRLRQGFFEKDLLLRGRARRVRSGRVAVSFAGNRFYLAETTTRRLRRG